MKASIDKNYVYSNLSVCSPHQIAAAILTLRTVCKTHDSKCEGCELSIFDPVDKTHTCGLWDEAPSAWDLNAPPAKPWRAFKQIGEEAGDSQE